MYDIKSFMESLINSNNESLIKTIIEGYDAIFEYDSGGKIYFGTSQQLYDYIKAANGKLPYKITMSTDLDKAKAMSEHFAVGHKSAPVIIQYDMPTLAKTASIMYAAPGVYRIDGVVSGEAGAVQQAQKSNKAPAQSNQSNLQYNRSGNTGRTKTQAIDSFAKNLVQTGNNLDNQGNNGGLRGIGNVMQIAGGGLGAVTSGIQYFRDRAAKKQAQKNARP